VIIVLFLLYPLAIQYERGGFWRLLLPITLITAIIDVYVNYTELALITCDWPKAGEYTVSDKLERIKNLEDWRGKTTRFFEPYLDYCDPDGNHI